MELSFLEHAANVPVVVRRPGIGARLRVAPGARKIGAILRLQEGDQGYLAHRRNPSKSRASAADRVSLCVPLALLETRYVVASLRCPRPWEGSYFQPIGSKVGLES